MREGQRLPEGWLEPGEKWPGQNDGLPEPGTPESREYHRKAWENEHPLENEPHPNSTRRQN